MRRIELNRLLAQRMESRGENKGYLRPWLNEPAGAKDNALCEKMAKCMASDGVGYLRTWSSAAQENAKSKEAAKKERHHLGKRIAERIAANGQTGYLRPWLSSTTKPGDPTGFRRLAKAVAIPGQSPLLAARRFTQALRPALANPWWPVATIIVAIILAQSVWLLNTLHVSPRLSTATTPVAITPLPVADAPGTITVDAGDGFVITVPADWRQTVDDRFLSVFLAPVSSGYMSSVSIFRETLSNHITLEEAVNAMSASNGMADYRLGAEGKVQLIDGPGYQVIYTWKPEGMDTHVTQSQVFCIINSRLYVLTATALSSEYDRYEDTFNSIMMSWHYREGSHPIDAGGSGGDAIS